MKFPCEEMANKIIPAIRAEIAIKLAKEYNKRQVEISELLGITQGAVSHYISSFRGKEREMLYKHPEMEKYIDEITKEIAEGNFESENFCKYCNKIKKLISSSDL